jgi:hypothetical protein
MERGAYQQLAIKPQNGSAFTSGGRIEFEIPS